MANINKLFIDIETVPAGDSQKDAGGDEDHRAAAERVRDG